MSATGGRRPSKISLWIGRMIIPICFLGLLFTHH